MVPLIIFLKYCILNIKGGTLMYMITVRPKAGELTALSFIPDYYRDQLIPNFTISAKEDIDKIIQKYSYPLWFDMRNLNLSELPFIEHRIQKDDKCAHAKIVYPLSYILQYSVDPRNCVRFTTQDLSNDYSWLENHRNHLPNTILIDFGYISGIPDQGIKDNVIKLINLLGNRNIILSSGSIPEKLKVSRTTDFIQPRYEKQFYQQLSKQSPTPIIYGDYGTVSPIPTITTGKIIIPTVQLKYTRDDSYLFVRNGKRKEGYDIYSVAEKIVRLHDFNESHCMGEKGIKEISLKLRIGNAATWISLGMNHHIMLCIEENL
ncbi:hypothetical protein FDP16_10980 [Streptococcus sanguinis]|uniref:Beta protein n=2 Tax=Streptococcus sanguinis TaxID=1305 RepID=A0A7H8V348_STRSA|nr:hypothetical protein FDP16_10980 [Streptococcus sanguinis]